MEEDKKSDATSKPAKLPDHLADSAILKEFRLGRVLTEDVTGTIYEAGQKFLGKKVVINVLAPTCKILSESLIKINHPNICRAYKILKLKEGTIIVLEPPQGKPILSFIEDTGCGDFSVSQGISAILQLLSALHAVHQMGHTVRNLNVNNIFLSRDDKDNLKLKLVSIGIGGPSVNLKAPHYLSPESILDTDKGDQRADIWSAGAVFYNLCFGKPPFGDEDAYKVAQKNLLETPNFDEKDKRVPNELIDILKKALERDEEKRYQTVSEMVGDLLPLREVYNEPMSLEVSLALRNSYPPPPPDSSQKDVPKKPKPLMGAMVMGLGDSSKQDRRDNTLGFEKTGKQKTEKKEPASKSLFGSRQFATPVKRQRVPSVKTSSKPSHRTLLGMPAITDADLPKEKRAISRSTLESSLKKKPQHPIVKRSSESVEIKDTPSASKGSAGKEKPGAKTDSSSKKTNDFFSPRSILGNEDEIKALENEMDFLEQEEDEDVPTLVTSQESFVKLVSEAMKKKPASFAIDEKPVSTAAEKKKPASTAAEKKPASTAAGKKKPASTVAEKKPASTAAEKKPASTAAEKKPALTAAEKKPAPIAAEKNLTTPHVSSAASSEEASHMESVPLSPIEQPIPPPLHEHILMPNDEMSEIVTVNATVAEMASMTTGHTTELQDAPSPPQSATVAPLVTDDIVKDTADAPPLSGLLKNVANSRKAIVGAIVAGGLVLILIIVFLVAGGDQDDETTSPKRAALATAVQVPMQQSGVNPSPPPEKAEEIDIQQAEPVAPNDVSDTSSDAASNVVTVSLANLPNGATVKVNGRSMVPPLTAPLSNTPVKVTIAAPGYKPFRTTLKFDKSKEISVDMKAVKTAAKPKLQPQKTAKNKNKNKNKKKKKKKGKKKKSKALVSNPFK